MKREEEFAKNSAIISLGTIFPKLATLITLPIVTACLSKADYGTYDLVLILVFLFLPVATLQIQTAAFRYLIEARGDIKRQKTIITNIILFTVPVCIAALFILFFFLVKVNYTTRLLILLYFFVDIILITARQIARGLSKNAVFSVSALLNSVLEVICVFLFLYVLKGGLDSAIFALIIPQTISLTYLVFRTRLYSYLDIKTFSFGELKTLLNYSWPLVPNSLSSWVMRVSDRLILTWFMGIETSAVYAVANKLPNMYNILQNTFSLAWQENAAVSVNDKDSSEYYGKIFDSILNLFVGVMALLIAFTPILFRLLIHGDYDEAYTHILILYIAVFFSIISSYLGGIYIAHKKSKQIGISTTIAAATNFIINILFVKRIGIYAASLSTLISYLWLAIYRMIDIQKIQKIRFNYTRICVLVAVLVCMTFVSFRRNVWLDLANIVFAIIIMAVLNKKLIIAAFKMMKKKVFRLQVSEDNNDKHQR